MVLESTEGNKSSNALSPQEVVALSEIAEVFGPLLFHRGLRAVEAQVAEAERGHRRGRLLAAYRNHRVWRASDAPGLKSLGASAAAVRRAVAAGGTGRPRVNRYVSLGALLESRLRSMSHLLSGCATETQRRTAFQHWPWSRFHVEAMYRGELNLARAAGTRSAYEAAERAVPSALRTSPSSVRCICSRVRTPDAEDASGFPATTVTEFEHWMRTGKHPKRWLSAD